MKKLSIYFPGIILFLIALVIGLLVYQDYGIGWDEPGQRDIGVLNYEYVFNGNQKLFEGPSDHHGAAFEMALVVAEKTMKITDPRDIYLMRHLVSHIFFLLAMFLGYILFYRLFKNQFIACLGFIMLVFAPRIYVHSFINSKDVPFLSLTIILFALCHLAFERKKSAYFILLGLVCGYATGIRVMGIMFAGIILLFLLLDLGRNIIRTERLVKPISEDDKINPTKLNSYFSFMRGAKSANSKLFKDFRNEAEKEKNSQIVGFILSSSLSGIILFSAMFCLSLYISWPYLWKTPVHSFVESYTSFSHFKWLGQVLFKGHLINGPDLSWDYFPTWFLISNPPLWLISGFCGMALLAFEIVRRPLRFVVNTTNRNFLMYLVCFVSPVLAVILLHSVIYDDWRHLYFVYPCFVLIALYFINKLIHTRAKPIVILACVTQIGFISYFMVKSHPFEQVYFNSFISHKPEYLRKNYDLEYWGCGFKQALEHLVATDPGDSIKIAASEYDDPLVNNIMMLQQKDRKRIIRTRSGPDYFITDFRLHPDNYDYPKVAYAIKVLNSTVLCVYKTH